MLSLMKRRSMMWLCGIFLIGSLLQPIGMQTNKVAYAADSPVNYDTLIDDFESGADGWDVQTNAGAGASNLQQVDASVAGTIQEGNYAAQFTADFTAGSVVTMMYKALPADMYAEKLAFWVKTDSDLIVLRIEDEENQQFSHAVNVSSTNDWQQVVIENFQSPNAVVGKTDGIWHGYAKSIRIGFDSRTIGEPDNASFFIDDVRVQEAEASAPTGVVYDTLIDDFESGADGWNVQTNAGAGASNLQQVDASVAGTIQEGDYAAQFTADFTAGSVVTMMYKALPASMYAEKLAFWVKTDSDLIVLRIEDEQGQQFSHAVNVSSTNDWQQVVIEDFQSPNAVVGKTDGIWHGYAKSIRIGFDSRTIGEPDNASFFIDDVRVQEGEVPPPASVVYDTLIDDFEAGVDGWDVQTNAGAGASNLEQVDASVAGTIQEGDYAAQFTADFTAGSVVTMMYKALPADMYAEKLAFWVKTDSDLIVLRIEDEENQQFSHAVNVSSTNDWQQVVIEDFQSPNAVVGKTDGIWHGYAKSIRIGFDSRTIGEPDNASFFIDDVRVQEGEAPPETHLTLIEDFEDGAIEWFNDITAVPGGTSEIAIIEDAFKGDYAAKLSANFNEIGSVITMRKELDVNTSIKELSFWIKTDLKNIVVRAEDATGQVFHHSVNITGNNEWEKVVIKDLHSNNYFSGTGAADGHWHDPVSAIRIGFNKQSLPTNTTSGSIIIDEVRGLTPHQIITIEQTAVGNIFLDNEIPAFIVNADGDEVAWAVADFWGNEVAEGQQSIVDGQATLAIDDLPKGYYTLSADALASGQTVGHRKTVFAILPQPIDLSTVSDSPFGVATHFERWNQAGINLIAKAGIKHVRSDLWWNQIEVNPGEYIIPNLYQRFIDKFDELDLNYLAILGYRTPYYDNNYTPYSEAGYKAFTNYIEAIIDLLPDQIDAFQVYNEYNIHFSNGPAAQDVGHYYRMLKDTYNTIKTKNSDIEVVGLSTAGLPWAWIENLFELNDQDGKSLDFLDSVGTHPYRYPDTPEGLRTSMLDLADLIRQYNDGQDKAMWITEYGYPTNTGSRGSTEEEQASYVVRSYIEALSAGVSRMYYYDFINDGPGYGVSGTNVEHNFGLIRHVADKLGPLTPKPAYVSYANMANLLTGASYKVQEDVADDVHSYVFEKNGEDIRVVWATKPEMVSLISEDPIVITDMLGNEEEYTPINGQVAYQLDENVIYIAGDVKVAPKMAQMFSVNTADMVAVNEEFEVELQLDNTENNQSFSATYVVNGVTHVLNADANEQATKTISLLAPSNPTTLNVITTVLVSDNIVAQFRNSVVVIDDISASSTHIIEDNQDFIQITIVNHAPNAVLLETIDWQIGDLDGEITADLTIEANTEVKYKLDLSNTSIGKHAYELLLNFNHKSIPLNGDVVLIDHDELFEIHHIRSPLSTNPIIDLRGPDSSAQHLSNDGGVEDLSGEVQLYWDEQHLYLTATIQDDVHFQPYSGSDVWQGDGIQLGLSSGVAGEELQNYEIALSLTENGPQVYYFVTMGDKLGLVEEADLIVTRDESEKLTTYRLTLPWELISPLHPDDTLLAFSLLVNDNDGDGRKGWIQWASGIGLQKITSEYNTLIFGEVPPNIEISAVSDLVDMTVNHGTSIEDLNLPNEVTVTLEDESTAELDVTWDNGEPVYDGNTAGTYTFTGTIVLEPGITNVGNHTAKVDVIVKAKVPPVDSGGGGTTPTVPDQPGDEVEEPIEEPGEDDGSIEEVQSFIDVDDHWAEEAIEEATRKEYITGYPDGSFRPEHAVSRQEWLVILNRLIKPVYESTSPLFKDTDRIGSWALQSVEAGVTLGWINGYPDGTFQPARNLTRAEAAKVLALALELEISQDINSTNYTDDDQIADWAKPYIQAVTDAGLFNGMPDGSFKPDSFLTRAEAVKLIMLAEKLYQ